MNAHAKSGSMREIVGGKRSYRKIPKKKEKKMEMKVRKKGENKELTAVGENEKKTQKGCAMPAA